MSEPEPKSASSVAFENYVRSISGYDDIEAEIIVTISTLFRDLLLQNWSQIKNIRQRSEETAVKISFGFDVDSSGAKPLVKGKLTFSEKFSDELDAWVDDPQQKKLNLNN